MNNSNSSLSARVNWLSDAGADGGTNGTWFDLGRAVGRDFRESSERSGTPLDVEVGRSLVLLSWSAQEALPPPKRRCRWILKRITVPTGNSLNFLESIKSSPPSSNSAVLSYSTRHIADPMLLEFRTGAEILLIGSPFALQSLRIDPTLSWLLRASCTTCT